MKKILRWLCCLHLLLPSAAPGWQGEAVKVSDGDTLHVKQGEKIVYPDREESESFFTHLAEKENN